MSPVAAPPQLRPAAGPPTIRVDRAERRIALSDPRTFGPGGEDLCDRFLQRVLALDEVRGVEVDRARGAASIRHRAAAAELPGFLRRLAGAIRGDEPTRLPLSLPRGARGGHFAVFRHRDIASTWEVVDDGPGRLKLRHDLLRRDHPRAERVAAALAEVPGVRRARPWAWSGTLLVVYDRAELNPARLIRLAEDMLDEPAPWGPLPAPPEPVSFTLANITVGIAAAGQFVLPFLLPISAGLLVAMNLGTFRATWRELRARHFGLPVLYTAIVATTLLSGQFFSSALMYWFFQFWFRRYRHAMASERHRLLDECLPRPRLVRLWLDSGAEVFVGPEKIGRGDTIVAGPGDIVPADIRVLSGDAMVDESALTGRQGVVRKRAGSAVLAGSVVAEGEVRAVVERAGEDTRAAALSRALLAATSPAPGSRAPTREAESFADQTVAPALTAAGLGGLLTGDLNAVGAILRPDYATGPGLSVPLQTLGAIERGLARGILIRDPAALDRLPGIDLIVVDDDPALRRFGLVVDRVETRLDEAHFFRIAASTFRHVADDRAGALERACRERGGHLVDVEPIDLRGGVTALSGEHRVRVRDSGPVLGDEFGLVVEVDDVPIGLISFRTGSALAAAEPLGRLREAAPAARLAVISDRPEAELAPLAVGLGVDSSFGGLDVGGKARFLAACRAQGLRVAFAGDCLARAAVAAQAVVAIHLGDDPAAPAAIQSLSGRLDGLDALWRIARDHGREVRAGRLGVIVPNLLCVAGALLFGFTGLHSVMISNLGTLGTYSRAAAALESPRSRGRRRSRPGKTRATTAKRGGADGPDGR